MDTKRWAVDSIFEFTRTYFCCPECDCKEESKQDFINHVSIQHAWVSFNLNNFFNLQMQGITVLHVSINSSSTYQSL